MRYLFLILFCMPMMVWGQRRGLFDKEFHLPQHDDKFIHFGINFAYNASHYNFLHNKSYLSQDSIMVVQSMNSKGFNLGWLVNFRLSEHLSLRTYPLDLIFTEKAFEYRLKYPDKPAGEKELMVKKIQGISMALPVQLKFQSDRIDNLRVFIMAGMRTEFDFAADKGATNAERMFKMEKVDYGLEGGIGFHIYFPVFVLTPELKIYYGLKNVHSRDPNYKFSSVLDQVNARSLSFAITVE